MDRSSPSDTPSGGGFGRQRRGRKPQTQGRGERRAPVPLDAPRMEEMALAYVARFANSAGKLTAYLRRKLRERGWAVPAGNHRGDDAEDGEASPALSPEAQAAGTAHALSLVARFVALGYVDDAGFARARSGSLLRRGFGERRVDQALGAAGIDAELRAEVRPDEAAARAAVLAMARKRGFGPYARGTIGGEASTDRHTARALREKQVAAMLRGGHRMAHVRAVIAAGSVAEAESWASDVDKAALTAPYGDPDADFEADMDD